MRDLTPEEAGRWIDAAPPAVQKALTGEETERTLADLAKRHTLHVDVAGLLMKYTSYMLLGYAGPEEFLRGLRAAGVQEQQAREIIEEVNKNIFIPIRQKMEKEDENSESEEPMRERVAVPQPPTLRMSEGANAVPANLPGAMPPIAIPNQGVGGTISVTKPSPATPPLQPNTPPQNPPTKVVSAIPPSSSPTPPPGEPYAVDPYREPIDG